jgi:hypothetical protein
MESLTPQPVGEPPAARLSAEWVRLLDLFACMVPEPFRAAAWANLRAVPRGSSPVPLLTAAAEAIPPPIREAWLRVLMLGIDEAWTLRQRARRCT